MREVDKQIIRRVDMELEETVEIVLPIIHMNGNSRQSLLDEIQNAISALTAGKDALVQMAPNGRNYYPVPGLLEKALEQHRKRLTMMHALLRDLEYEAIGIAEDDFNGDEP